MLKEISILNFAIIRKLDVGFGHGLNIISGETGAGKSILVGAVNLLLGARASQEMIRTGANEASVEAVFAAPSGGALAALMRDWGIESGSELVLRRSVNRGGRSRVFVNDQALTVQQLQQLSQRLISISGQHEHQLLLDPDTHLGLLDAFGGLDSPCREVGAIYCEWAAAREALQKLRRSRQEKAAHLDFLNFQLQELEGAKLKPGEDEALGVERNILKHAEVLLESARAAYGALYAERGAILERLSEIEAALSAIIRIDGSQNPLLAHAEQGRIQLEELAHSLQQYVNRVQFDPQRLADVEERLALLQKLGKKYGGSADAMLARLEELRQTLSAEEDSGFHEEELEKNLDRLRRAYREKAGELSALRAEAALRLSAEVERSLSGLDMPRARFEAGFATRVRAEGDEVLFSQTGLDRVEFLLSANPGEDLKPLAKIASGGELSRILLALKSLLSRTGDAETLIFDEVDSGIGGRTAELVGLQLNKLAGRHQVICITHLPQIASYGERHYRVEKHSAGGETSTRIESLSEQQRFEELARMLGGISITDKTRAHAKDLLRQARERK